MFFIPAYSNAEIGINRFHCKDTSRAHYVRAQYYIIDDFNDFKMPHFYPLYFVLHLSLQII